MHKLPNVNQWQKYVNIYATHELNADADNNNDNAAQLHQLSWPLAKSPTSLNFGALNFKTSLYSNTKHIKF